MEIYVVNHIITPQVNHTEVEDAQLVEPIELSQQVENLRLF